MYDQAKKGVAGLPPMNAISQTLRTQHATLLNKNPEALCIQLAVKAGKGVVVEEEAKARELGNYAKAVHAYALEQAPQQAEEATKAAELAERWAFLLFKESLLAQSHALEVDKSRVELKDIVTLSFHSDRRWSTDKNVQPTSEISRIHSPLVVPSSSVCVPSS